MDPSRGFTFVSSPELIKVSELICDEWARPCWNYDVDLLSAHLMRPSGDPDLAIGQVSNETGKLVSYLAYMPFQIEYFGKVFTTVFGSFLTVSKDYFFRGVSRSSTRSRARKGQLRKATIASFTVCEDGSPANASIKRTYQNFGIEIKKNNGL